MADIPVYLVAGFLDAGKTNFINGILEDGFARQDRTLLLCCEEGEEEYNSRALDNVTVITIEDEEELELAADACRQIIKSGAIEGFEIEVDEDDEDSEEYNEDYLSDIKNMIPGISIEQEE